MARLYKRRRPGGGRPQQGTVPTNTSQGTGRGPGLDSGFRRNDGLIVLVSGGLDSAVLLGEMAHKNSRVYPLYIRQGLAWEKVELYWLKRFLKALGHPQVKPLQILDMPMRDVYAGHWSLSKKVPGYHSKDEAVYLPGRNLVLLVKVAIFAVLNGLSRIALGSLGHNPFPDASPEFFKQWAKTLSRGLTHSLAIETPYRQMSKVQVIQRGREFPLQFSFSCLAPVGKNHCGCCNKCAERQKAFKAAGVTDKTRYEKR